MSAAPTLSDPAMTGRMPCVCSWCLDPLPAVACLPKFDGQVTHGLCPACKAGLLAFGLIQPTPTLSAALPPETGSSSSSDGRVHPGAARAEEQEGGGTSPSMSTQTMPGSARPVPGAVSLAGHYRSVHEIASVCGLSATALENQYRPDSWGAPRDFRYLRTEIQYAVASLPQLVAALRTAGQLDAALCLGEWVARLTAEIVAAVVTSAEPAPEGTLKAVEHVEAPASEINAALAPAMKHGREQAKHWWDEKDDQ